ncbi:MAG: HDOD domain-containing protein [Burkholderiaceae bacterium]|nr:HDOD domain-containing protein [Burkholderiaceae bacterium]
MDQQQETKVQAWVKVLGTQEVPVLRQTFRSMVDAHQRMDWINAREISQFVLHDPMMTLRVLSYLHESVGKRQMQEITTVGNAIIMLGINPFFRHFEKLAVVEDALKPHPQALLQLVQLVKRAQVAQRWAFNWATWRYDKRAEEVAIAALLHDLAEIVLWCFAPQKGLEILALRKANPTARSAQLQEHVLGFHLLDLQLALCYHWHLPELLTQLMDDAHADNSRIKNVKLAVDLARHSANGWDDPALPDDYAAIEKLLNISHEELMTWIKPKDKESS